MINLSFANVKENRYEKVRYRIGQILMNLYLENRFLLEGDILELREKAYFNRISETMNEEDATMQEAYVNGYWEQMVSFMRSMFNAAFKTNPYLERAIMTGITRVSKESIFSDLNNLEVVTTTSPKYDDCFGFTEEYLQSVVDPELSG